MKNYHYRDYLCKDRWDLRIERDDKCAEVITPGTIVSTPHASLPGPFHSLTMLLYSMPLEHTSLCLYRTCYRSSRAKFLWTVEARAEWMRTCSGKKKWRPSDSKETIFRPPELSRTLDLDPLIELGLPQTI